MMSATVMALARLLYEFAGRLDNAVPRLLPAVLMLLRTKSREIVKSVLGFVKVSC
jgi:ribosomal RNA-processing protein 12